MSIARDKTVEDSKTVLERQGLVGQIEEGATLCILRAPQGYGKSVVLRQWADQATSDVVWVEPASSLAGSAEWVVASSPWGTSTASSPVTEAEVPTFLEALLATNPETVIVIDGLHRMRDRTTHQSIAALLRKHPHARMIVTTRSRSPLESLVAATNTVSADSLAFDATDVVALADMYGAVLDQRHAEELADAFGGWPAMIDKVLRHLAKRPVTPERVRDAITATDASFTSWLLDDVIEPRLVELMVTLAVAETLTAESARFLTNDDRVVESLEQLVEQGLLGRELDLDTNELVYAFPSVIRRVALAGMGRVPEENDDERSAALASWWRERGRPEIALRQAYAGKDWLFIAELCEESWWQLYNLDVDFLTTVLRQLPADVARAFSRTHAIRHLILGTTVSAEDIPKPAVRSFLDVVDLARRTNPVHAAERAVADFIVLRRSGRYEDAVRLAKVAHHLLTIIGSRIPAYLRPFMPMARLQLALTYKLAGHGKDASEQLNHSLTELERSSETKPYELNQILGVIAVKAAIEGDMSAAEVWLSRQVEEHGAPPRVWFMPHVPSATQISRAIIATETLNQTAATAELNELRLLQTKDELWALAAWAQARHDLLWSDRAGAFHHLDIARTRHEEWLNPESAAEVLLLAAEVDLLLAAGEGTRAAALLTKTTSAHPMVQLSRARLKWLTGNSAGALKRTKEILRTRHVTERVRLETLVLRATLFAEGGDHAKARSHWAEACAMASRMGDPIVPFVLTHAEAREQFAADIPELARVSEQIRAAGIREIFPSSVNVITLTERELAVLECIADGTSVAAIARLQFVSEATVKSQMRSFYGKLGAHSREEAVNAAIAAGILSI